MSLVNGTPTVPDRNLDSHLSKKCEATKNELVERNTSSTVYVNSQESEEKTSSHGTLLSHILTLDGSMTTDNEPKQMVSILSKVQMQKNTNNDIPVTITTPTTDNGPKRTVSVLSQVHTPQNINTGNIHGFQASVIQHNGMTNQNGNGHMLSQILTSQSAGLMPGHPILQQIQHLNKMYQNNGFGPPRQTPAASTVDLTEQEEMGKMTDDGIEESVSSEVFSKYIHREIVPGCLPHPGGIVEAGPLAELLPPDPTYPLVEGITSDIVTEGKLSSLQLEGVLYACQRHQMILPNGQRAGFFIGDAAGVGKGRQIAGIILDNFSRKRTKHIWFTISADLIVDARRDLTDLGCHIRVIDGCQELDKETRVLGLPADFKEGVVLSTYATLVSSVQRGGVFSTSKNSRLQQLVKWCGGEDFDGCLIFDECHKAKNFVPGKEQNSTKVAMSVATIQRLLPKARVVYCSATGVTDVKNMAFMERLGLWGEGAPFKSFEQFLDTVHKKGLGMAEMLAMEMKMSGMYVSRGLSYKQAEFMTVEAPLTPEQKKVYDLAAHVWNELRKSLESASVRCNSSNTRLWTQYWSAHQRFFKQLCMGMKVPAIVKEAQEALDAGYCVVIGLQTTGEASLDSEITKKGTLTSFMSLCREIMTRFIMQYFPNKVESKIAKVEPQLDPWSNTAKEMLLGFAEKISLPDSPLDEIIDKLGGPSKVAEMTGRRGRIVRQSPTEKPRYEQRSADIDTYGGVESLNVQERNQFMEGKKLIAIISDAASTGISLHADLRVANQRRRVHLTVELPWSADKAVQQLGRSHRSNQSSGPLYKLLTTDLGGERRFAASVARRLQSMGALTKGDRRAATGADLGEFNFDTPYGRNSLRLMYQHICTRKLVPGIDLTQITKKYNIDQFIHLMQESLVLMGLADLENVKLGVAIKDSDAGDVSKFLNRILGISVEKQNMMFTYFTEVLKLTVENARKEGRYNEGMLDITASYVEMVGEPKEIFKELKRGHASTRLVELSIDRGMSWEMAVTRSDNYKGPNDGFYISRRDMWGRKLCILATQKENSSHLFRISRPNTGLSFFEEEKSELMHKYVPLSTDKAEKLWNELYTQSKDQCIHGKSCKHSKTCRVGSRCYRMHLLCGSIVSHMSLLEATLNRFASKLNLSKSETTIRVVRVKLNNGDRVVGVRYPEVLIRQVEKVLTDQNRSQQTHLVSSQGELQLSQSVGNSSDLGQSSDTFHLTSSPSTSGIVIKTEPGLSMNTVASPKPSASGNRLTQTSLMDPVTPVCLKTQRKAFRPPMTIRNFFKPSVLSSSNDTKNVMESMENVQCNNKRLGNLVGQTEYEEKSNSSENSEKLQKDCDGFTKVQKYVATRKVSEEKSCVTVSHTGCKVAERHYIFKELQNYLNGDDFNLHDSLKCSGIHETENILTKVLESKDKCLSKSECKYKVEISITGCKTCSSTNKDNFQDKKMKETKRRAISPVNTPPSKRRKQSSIMNSFAKAATKKEQVEKKERLCPICQHKFEEGTSNEDINKHIDNCLIE